MCFTLILILRSYKNIQIENEKVVFSLLRRKKMKWVILGIVFSLSKASSVEAAFSCLKAYGQFLNRKMIYHEVHI
jgi:hypothetical protein